jgi:hypothetical protein
MCSKNTLKETPKLTQKRSEFSSAKMGNCVLWDGFCLDSSDSNPAVANPTQEFPSHHNPQADWRHTRLRFASKVRSLAEALHRGLSLNGIGVLGFRMLCGTLSRLNRLNQSCQASGRCQSAGTTRVLLLPRRWQNDNGALPEI